MSGRQGSLFALLLVASCGGGEPEPEVAIARQGPAEQIFRVGRTWETQATESGFRTPPSPIGTFSGTIVSRVLLDEDQRTAREKLAFVSSFKLQDGREFRCEASTEVTLPVRYADHHGEAAVEMQRPRIELMRRCTPGGFPEPRLEIPATAARFVLRADRLIPFAPFDEHREYLPVQ
jgi:hypothetical protein